MQSVSFEETIRQIHREVTENRRVLEEKEAQARLAEEEIPILESRVSTLRAQIVTAETESYESRQQIARLHRARDEIQEQAKQLRELGEVFESQQPDHSDSGAVELPPDLRAQVLRKIDEAIATVCTEYSGFDASEFDAFFKESNEVEAAIDGEIEILSQLTSDGWFPRDELQDCLTEFCSHFGPPPTASRLTLSSVTVPHAVAPLEIFERRFTAKASLPSLEKLKSDSDRLNSLFAGRLNREADIYRDQRGFLEELKAYLLRYEAAFDPDAIRRELTRQMRLLRKTDLIVPLRIPSGDEPLAAITSEIGRFIEELERNRRSALLLSELERSADEVVRVPEFTVPPAPKYVKNPIPSPQLVELADHLREIGEAAKQLMPVTAIQSLTNSYRRSLSEEPPTQSVTQVSEEIELDPECLIQFRQTVTSKLPAVIARRFESCDFSGRRIEYEEVEDDFELDVDRDLEERSATLNSLLRSMAALQLPAIPTFSEPPTADFPIAALDSDPLLKAAGQLLSSDLQSASVLKAEISDLEQRVATVLEEVAVREEQQQAVERALRELSDQIAATEKVLSVISARVTLEGDEVTQLRRERSEAQARQTEMQEEINASADIGELIATREAELSEMREELANSRRNVEDEEEFRKQLLEGIRQDQLLDAD
jgi:predicted  nucleic acid-binding Zn-ribbon protein